ncbi:MAG: hypothetical protein RBR50_01075 [Candidatus Izemoplasmatales bacterium]|nr:hypothetical protein [Candidatus Izemoplasmatales bacterium]
MNATYKGKPLIEPKRPSSLEKYRNYLIKEKVIDEKGRLCIVNKASYLK